MMRPNAGVWCVVVSSLLVLSVAAIGGISAFAASPSGVVSFAGVTPLRLLESTERDVLQIAGPPDRRSTKKTPDNTRYRTLSYGCSNPTSCVTEYQISFRTGTLAGFRTRSGRYRSVRGARVGMTRQKANAREPRFHLVICGGLRSRTSKATLDFGLSRGDKTVTSITVYAPELGGVYDACY